VRRPGLSDLDRRIIGLALPALGALIVEPLYNLTDTAIVGHLGRAQLGGLAIATTVLNLLGWTTGFFDMATTSRVALRRGQGDEGAATEAAIAAYAGAVGVGLVLAALVVWLGPDLAHLLGARGAIAHNATTYLRISAAGMPFLLITLAGSGHLTGYEDTKTPLRIVLVANLVNVVLEVVLVYGAHTGVAGSAWGTVAAQVVAATLFIAASRARVHAANRRPGWPAIAEFVVLARSGVALVGRTAALGAALLLSTGLAARVGAATLAGHQIGMQVWLLLALTLDALAVPAQVFVSTAVGAGRLADAAEIGRRCLRLGLVIGVAVGVVTAALAGVLPIVFSGDAAVRHVATIALLLCGAMQPLAALAFVYDGLVLGLSDYLTLRRAMVLALLGFAPFFVATALDHRLGITGIWLALLCWLGTRSLLLARRWRTLTVVREA
jgi:putative MATE family efflux protein